MATGTEQTDEESARFQDELARELASTVERLGGANADLKEITSTAMDLALRLDDCEKMLAGAQEELALARGGDADSPLSDFGKLQKLSREQAVTIANQHDYIQRLRRQTERPLRLMAKRILRPLRKK